MSSQRFWYAVHRFINRLLQTVVWSENWDLHYSTMGILRLTHLGRVGSTFSWFRRLAVSLRWFDATNRLELSLSLQDDLEDTVYFKASLPWLVRFNFSLDILPPNALRRLLGRFQERRYGLAVDMTALRLQWHLCPESSDDNRGFEFFFPWERIHGKMTVTTTTEPAIELKFTQPASHGYEETIHDATLIFSVTIQNWSMPWKSPERRSGFDVKVDYPPLFEGKGENNFDQGKQGIYGMYVPDALTTHEALKVYIDTVEDNRRRYG